MLGLRAGIPTLYRGLRGPGAGQRWWRSAPPLTDCRARPSSSLQLRARRRLRRLWRVRDDRGERGVSEASLWNGTAVAQVVAPPRHTSHRFGGVRSSQKLFACRMPHAAHVRAGDRCLARAKYLSGAAFDRRRLAKHHLVLRLGRRLPQNGHTATCLLLLLLLAYRLMRFVVARVLLVLIVLIVHNVIDSSAIYVIGFSRVLLLLSAPG